MRKEEWRRGGDEEIGWGGEKGDERKMWEMREKRIKGRQRVKKERGERTIKEEKRLTGRCRADRNRTQVDM